MSFFEESHKNGPLRPNSPHVNEGRDNEDRIIGVFWAFRGHSGRPLRTTFAIFKIPWIDLLETKTWWFSIKINSKFRKISLKRFFKIIIFYELICQKSEKVNWTGPKSRRISHGPENRSLISIDSSVLAPNDSIGKVLIGPDFTKMSRTYQKLIRNLLLDILHST